MKLGRLGVWSAALRTLEPAAAASAAAELEGLGYTALWFPGGSRQGFAQQVSAMLQATQRVAVASGIVSIWTHPAADVTADFWRFEARHHDRFLLGLGISHQHVVERAGLEYRQPLARLRSYLAELDAQPQPVPPERRVLASLGPRSLHLAREHAWGTHPYFVPVAHTRLAREALGPNKLVAPELMVVLDNDATTARAIAREHMATYLAAPNYATTLLRLGYSTQDLGHGGSDRIVDDIVAWGDPERILERVQEHQRAGADHVCVQVLNSDRRAPALDEWRRLAQTFFGAY